MKLKSKKFILPLLIVTIVCSILIINKNNNIEKILENKYYDYLPVSAKSFIKGVYEETGEIINTERNKKSNEPYLNPKYIEYLELSDEEKTQVELIPDTYIWDYEPNKSYKTQNLPATYDLRNVNGKKYISPIKDQGSTSICWAFATVENVETFYMKSKDQAYSDLVPKFSIRQMDYVTSTDYLVKDANWISCSGSCSWTPWPNDDNGSRKLDGGGNFFVSSIVMANGLTLTNETLLPWNEKKDPLWAKDIIGHDKSLYEVNSTIQMPTIMDYNVSEEIINSYVSDIKNYMLQYGGPFVGSYSPKSTCGFENIDGTKAMKTDECTNDSQTAKDGHAMQIIGWDDNYEYAYCDAGQKHYSTNNGNCTTGTLTQGRGAWIVRNSWGEETDEANAYKYIYLTYDSIDMSVGFVTSLSEMANRTWDNNYHSNPWIDKNLSNGMASVNEQTKEFDTHNPKAEKIEKIKFFTSTRNGKYTVSISTEEMEYNNIATINSNEVGIYTIDLSDKNIILNSNNFSVTITGENGDKFYNDTISVFTSNIDKTPSVTVKFTGAHTYSETESAPSETNPLFIEGGNYTGNVYMEHYTKNIPESGTLEYRVKLNGELYNGHFFSTTPKVNHIMDYVYTTLVPRDTEYSDKPVCGKILTFEIVYNDTVISSFPLKRICNNTQNVKVYTSSTVKFHKNDGSGYYSTITKKDLSNYQLMYSDGTGKEYIGDESKFFQYDKYIKSWNTKADGTGTTYTDNNLLVYTDLDLYAQWSNPSNENHQYIIKRECKRYICHESQTLSNSQYVTFNQEYKIPQNTYNNLTEGQEFIYWALDDSNESKGIFYEEEEVMNISEYGFKSPYNRDDTTYLSAVWSDSYNSISFDANGGTGSMKGIKIINGKTSRLKMNLFTRDGYVFTGWNTLANGTGTNYNDKSNISINEDITLYAQWEDVSAYELSLNGESVFDDGITLSLKVNKLSDENLTSLTGQLIYDKTKLNLLSYTAKSGYNIVYNSNTNEFTITGSNISNNENILTLVFKNTNLNDLESTNIDITNLVANNTEYLVKKDSISKTIIYSETGFIKGDMNENGKIDLQDIIILLKKYLAITEITSKDIAIGDMDDNGSIGLKDVIDLLKLYLNI